MIIEVIYSCLFVINVLAFGLYFLDKHNAVCQQWRIPEAVLLGLAVVGGAYGAGAGMLLARHKTKHKAFLVTVPLFFVLWMAVLVLLAVA